MRCANPTSELLKEAARVFGGDCWVATVTSIGEKPMVPLKNVTYAQSLEKALKNTDTVHQDLHHRLRQLNIYFRFDVPHEPIATNNAQSAYLEFQTYKSDGRTGQLIDDAIRSIHLRQQVGTLSGMSEYHIPSLIQSNCTISFGETRGNRAQTKAVRGTVFYRTKGYTRRPACGTSSRFAITIKWSNHQRISWNGWIREDPNIIEVRT
jgi:hypothetical protein